MPPYRNILVAFFPRGECEREPGFRLTTTHLAVDAAFHGREESIVVVDISDVRGPVGAAALGNAQNGFETDETDERVTILVVHLQFALKFTPTDCPLTSADLTDQEAGSDDVNETI